MATGGRSGRDEPSLADAASAVVQLPPARTRTGLPLARLLPSLRSLLAAFAILAIGGVCYLLARDTGVFAVRTVEVDGAPPAVARQVRDVLHGELGTSLLRVDRDAVRQRVLAVPTVAAVGLDRAFPHTLRITVLPERPVAVARQGADSWLLSARGRVMARLERGARPRLPRVWVGQGASFAVGGMAPATLDRPLSALAPLVSMRFPARVASVRASSDELTLLLRSGLELRLGDETDVRLKLAVAARVLPLVSSGTRYLDVSVPERPVAGSVLALPGAAATSGAAPGAAQSGAHATGTADTASSTLKSKVEVHGSASSGP